MLHISGSVYWFWPLKKSLITNFSATWNQVNFNGIISRTTKFQWGPLNCIAFVDFAFLSKHIFLSNRNQILWLNGLVTRNCCFSKSKSFQISEFGCDLLGKPETFFEFVRIGFLWETLSLQEILNSNKMRYFTETWKHSQHFWSWNFHSHITGIRDHLVHLYFYMEHSTFKYFITK